MLKLVNILLNETEFTYDTLDLDKAYDIFNKSYIISTGQSWEKDKFLERARNWTFFGDENGYVAVRPQSSGMVKLVGVAGSPKSIYKGIHEVKNKYNNTPLWGMVSKDISTQMEKVGFKSLKLKDDLKSKLFLKLIKAVIPSSVFGGAIINGINPDGTISFEYSDVGSANKVLVGNDSYFEALKEKVAGNQAIPDMMKEKINQLFVDSGLISEKRRGGDKNPKIHYTDMLNNYVDQDDIYVTFTHHMKAGINPNSAYDTPLGIYCFPLKISARFYGYDNGVIKFPFAADRPFIFILKEKPNIKKLIISEYTKDDGERDIRILVGIYKDIVENINELVEKSKETKFYNIGIGRFWYFCLLLSSSLPGRQTVNWNKLLRKDLGYDLVLDDKGYGVIHSNEKVQAFFTESSNFDVINLVDNPTPSDFPSNNLNAPKSVRKIKRGNRIINYKIIANNLKQLEGFLKSRNPSEEDISNILFYSEYKEKAINLILGIRRNRISSDMIYWILKYSTDKEKTADNIILMKGSSLDGESIGQILSFVGRGFVNKIINSVQGNIDSKGISEIFDIVGWNEGLSVQLAKMKGNNISEHDLTSLLSQKSDKVVDAIFEAKKNSLTNVIVYQLINKSENPKNIIDKIIPYASNSLDLDNINLIFSKYPKTDKSTAMRILLAKGSNTTEPEFLRIMSHDFNNAEEMAKHILTVKKENLSPPFIDAILTPFAKNPLPMMYQIMKYKKLDSADKRIFIKYAPDAKAVIEMVGGIPIEDIGDWDVDSATDKNGLIDFMLENKKIINSDLMISILKSIKDENKLFEVLIAILSTNFQALNSYEAFSYVMDIVDPEYTDTTVGVKLSPEKSNKIIDLIFKKMEDTIITEQRIKTVVTKYPKYVSRLIDAININFDSSKAAALLSSAATASEFEYTTDDFFNIVARIYNYIKDKPIDVELARVLVRYSGDIERLASIVGYEVVSKAGVREMLRAGIGTDLILDVYRKAGNLEKDGVSALMFNAKTVEDVEKILNVVIGNFPHLLQQGSVISDIFTGMKFIQSSPDFTEMVIKKIANLLGSDFKFNYNIIDVLLNYLANSEFFEYTVDIILNALGERVHDKNYSLIIFNIINKALSTPWRKIIVKKIINLIGKDRTREILNDHPMFTPPRFFDQIFSEFDSEKQKPVSEIHANYREYFRELYSQ